MGELALVLFWPALIGYSEAAVAYLGETIRPGRLARYAIWGVRLGWLAQTALLIAQAADVGRLPVGLLGRLAQPVRLDVRRRVPDLGLPRAVPAARTGRDAPRCGALPRSRGRPAAPEAVAASDFGSVFLALHVGLVLAAFAGFTLAAGLAAVYLWQNRRLKQPLAEPPAGAGPLACDARRR